MSSQYLIQHLQAKVDSLSDDDLEAKYDEYLSLNCRGVRDEIYLSIMEREMRARKLGWGVAA